MTITTTWHNANPNTIANKLAVKLGREATHAELTTEVKRILSDTTVELATAGKLPHQRKR